jgi:hypothetical protein
MDDITIDDDSKRGGGGALQFVTLFETNGDDDRSYSTSSNSGMVMMMMMMMIMYIYSAYMVVSLIVHAFASLFRYGSSNIDSKGYFSSLRRIACVGEELRTDFQRELRYHQIYYDLC